MRRRFRRKPKKKTPQTPQLKINDKIVADPIALIDQSGDFYKEISLFEARQLASEAGLDLVEVSPKANPPVCKILDYGKLQYIQAKKQKKQLASQKKTTTKGVRLGLRTDTHDLEFKRGQIKKFLEKGNKVKIEMLLRGREKAHQDLAKENLQKFLDEIETPFKIEEDIKKFPGGFNVIISPK